MVPAIWLYTIPVLEIIEGKHDDLPESAFLFVGTIDEAVEKAKKGGRA